MKGKWTYIHSELLNQTVALDEISGWLFCKDGTRYSPAELARTAGAEIPLAVHLAKKVFGGTLIATQKNNEPGDSHGSV